LLLASNPAANQPSQQNEDCPNTSALESNSNDCINEDTLPANLSVLAGLRKQAAVRLLAAAQSDQLQEALQILTNPTEKLAIQQNDDTQDVVAAQTDATAVETSACPFQDATISHVLEKDKVEKDNLLVQLRQRASLGMAVAAQDGSLGIVLQSATKPPAAESTHARKLPPRTPSKTPKLPRTPSVSPISPGGCGTLGRQIVPAPTIFPTPSGDSTVLRPADGHPGGFRRRHSRTSSKILG